MVYLWIVARILAIDYGRKRCGIAVTDPLRIIASGLCVVHPDELMTFLKDYMTTEEVDLIVLGLPFHEDGNPAQLHAEVLQLGSRLQRELPKIQLDYRDERYTSRMAVDIIRMSGAKRKKRQDKATVDKVSAGLILQDYLEFLEKKTLT